VGTCLARCCLQGSHGACAGGAGMGLQLLPPSRCHHDPWHRSSWTAAGIQRGTMQAVQLQYKGQLCHPCILLLSKHNVRVRTMPARCQLPVRNWLGLPGTHAVTDSRHVKHGERQL
jgi:hypothetical protein